MARELFSTTVTHERLGKSRVVSGSNRYVVQEKADALEREWNAAWQAKLSIQRERDKREASRQADLQRKQRSKEELLAYKQAQADSAVERSTEALQAVQSIQKILSHTLGVNDVVNWDSLKHYEKFPQSKPRMAVIPEPAYIVPPAKPDRADEGFNKRLFEAARLPANPREPSPSDAAFRPAFGFFQDFFVTKKRRRELQNQAYLASLADWEVQCKELAASNELLLHAEFEKMMTEWRGEQRLAEAKNANLLSQLNGKTESAKLDYERKVDLYQKDKTIFETAQQEHNQNIDQLKAAYEALEPGAVFDYFDLVLNASVYPEQFPREWELEYLADSRTVVLNYTLPSPSDMPTLKEVKYVATKDEFKESFYSERDTNALYDSALYEIALRTIHELFESDYAKALDAVVFNGIVHGVDKADGHNFTACVLSLQASKEEFLAIQLASIEPKACFKKLKGVGSSQLHGLSPVAPILQIDKSDKRFVDAYAVAGTLDESTNLAAMAWEDFEHLVRELFEKEFRSTGGEVHITQASRDGGVDAVAFDPDPIRGGKIVIQAKRYTNVVGVSAVRDLYGTVMNEGATKGILVTTANYGTDSYEFAKGKPLTLLNGSNLLHLLAKHGHKATIDIQAARAGQ